MERKNTGWKVLVCFLLIVILAMGGFILYDKVLKDKYFSKDKTKETDKKDDDKKDDTNVVKEKQKGTLDNLNLDKDSKTITLNGEEHTISYTFVDNGGPGMEYVKYDDTEIFSGSGAEGLGKISYTVFEGNDKKDYLFINFYSMLDTGYIVNDKGNILRKINTWVEELECTMFNNNNGGQDLLIYEKDGNIYYNEYISGSNKEEDSYIKAKANVMKINVEDNVVTSEKTGEQTDINIGQCK